MGVSTTVSIAGPYTADGININWTFNFKVISLAHLRLLVTDTVGIVTTVTGGFTATGIGSGAGGTVQYPLGPALPLPIGYKVVVQRLVPFTQDTILGNQGAYFPAIHEARFDLLTMEIQQLADQAKNTLFVPLSEGLGSFQLPSLALRANKTLGFDAAGNPVASIANNAAILAGNVPSPSAPEVGKLLQASAAGVFGWTGTGEHIASAVGGTANAITLTVPTGFGSATRGLVIFQTATPNTGATTVSVNGGPARTVFKPSGNGYIGLVQGDIQANYATVLYSDGTNYLLVSATPSVGRQSVWVPAVAMYKNNAVGGPSTGQLVVSSTVINYLAFDPVVDEDAQFHMAMPKGWNEGTIRAKFFWTHPATTVNFSTVWTMFIIAYSDNEAISGTPYGGAGNTVDVGGVTSNMYISAETAATTPGSTAVEGDMLSFIFRRVGSDGSDTLAVDAFLIGVMLFYDTNAEVDN